MTRTLIAALLLTLPGLAGTVTPVYEELAPYPQTKGFPGGPLVESRTGGLFGFFPEVQVDGETHPGGLFRLQKDKAQVLHRFQTTDGDTPLSLIQTDDGVLYGTCLKGGAFGFGTIWSYDPSNGVFRKLIDVPLGFGPAVLFGSEPDGTLYCRLNRELSRCSRGGTLAKLIPTENASPDSPITITLGSDGDYYGIDVAGSGSFFRIDADSNYESVVAFDGVTGIPSRFLVEGSDGAFYGISEVVTDERRRPQLLRITKEGEITVAYDFGGVTFGSEINRRVFLGPDQNLYLEVSRSDLAQSDPADLLLRFDVDTQEAVPLYTYTGAQRGAFPLLATDGNVYAASRDAEGRGIVTRVSGLGLAPINHSPFARADRLTLAAGATTITLKPLLNDGDLDGDSLSVGEYSEPENGTVEFDATKDKFTYTANDDSVLSDSFTYTISDGQGGTASARVQVLRAGPSRTYASEFSAHGAAAYCRATISTSGKLTGVLYTLGRKFLLRASLDEDRTASLGRIVTVPLDDENSQLANLTIGFEETLPTGTDSAELTVILEVGDKTVTETIDEAPRRTEAHPQYTLSIPPFDPLADSESIADGTAVQITDKTTRRPANLGGAGWMSMRVSDNGNVRVIGKLADGRAITFGGPFSGEETLPIYANCSPQLSVSPPPPRGFFAGTLDFSEEQGDESNAACSGIFRWTRPGAGEGEGVFQAGFAILQPVAGFRYKRSSELPAPPEEGVVLPVTISLPASPGLGPLELDGTTQAGTYEFTELKASFNLIGRDGIVTGTLKHPQIPKPCFASGIVIRRYNQVVGFYRTPSGSAQFIIKPD